VPQERRDPRFGSLSAGIQDPNLTAQSYSFVSGMMSDEYNNLKSALRDALRRERSAPWAEQAQRVAEREEVEAHLAKARSRYERYQREQREKKVLQQVKKEERAKQAEGKGEWHMKRGTSRFSWYSHTALIRFRLVADKKDLLLKARFQALEQEGGKRKVKKAIEKKQKKIAGKEKKSRPFARGQGGAGTGAGGGGGDGGDRKRRRVG
jgi:ribosomal RNA-processing protein 36